MEDNNKNAGLWELYKMGGITPAIASVFRAQSAQQMAFIRSVMKEQIGHSALAAQLDELKAVVFDLETTGFYPDQGDEIVSIGAVSVEGPEVVEDEQFYHIVKVKRPIPESVVKLTSITNEMAAGGIELIDALQRFLAFVHHRVLIVHGAGHDKQFLNAALWKTCRVRLTHRVLDTMMIGRWLRPNLERHGLDELLDSFGIPVTERHHALQDSIMTAKLWSAYVQEMKKRQVFTLSDLYAYLSR